MMSSGIYVALATVMEGRTRESDRWRKPLNILIGLASRCSEWDHCILFAIDQFNPLKNNDTILVKTCSA